MKILIYLVLVLIPVNTIDIDYVNFVTEVPVRISESGIQLICQFEGFRENPYLDNKGIPTIGYGTIQYDDGTAVTMTDQPISQTRAMELLEFNVNKKCDAINSAVTAGLTQNQFDALCSFTYNVGIHAFNTSTLLKELNSGNITEAADQLLRWDHVGASVDIGLLNRRRAEKDLFLKPDQVIASN